MEWTPAAVLPNLTATEAIEGEVVAFVPFDDVRVTVYGEANPGFKQFVSSFTDAFNNELRPVIQIVRNDCVERLKYTPPLASFRDVVALSVIPYARSLKTQKSPYHISCSNSFWIYPIMLEHGKYVVVSTPAVRGQYFVDDFHGQSSPEVPIMELKDVDLPLLDVLLTRWKRHYLGTDDLWEDRALFRSLNMANEAAKIPAGKEATVYDFGRSAALWVSAFEILSRPENDQDRGGAHRVFPLLDGVNYFNEAHEFGKDKSLRCLASLLYSELHKARNHFMHGNRLNDRPLNPAGKDIDLFWIAPWLYRFALTGFLDLRFKSAHQEPDDPERFIAQCRFEKYQRAIERALLSACE